MNEPIKYIIMGDPVPLARARHGNRRTWDSQKQLKLCIGIELVKQHQNRAFYSGPLHLSVTFYLAMPDRDKRRWDKIAGTPHHHRPDLSNLIKLIEDIATSILYDDDAAIARISAQKRYDYHPRTEFIITPL